MSSLFNAEIEQFDFTNLGISDLKNMSVHSEDWPVVYILNGSKEAYIGETQNAYIRMSQHLANKKDKRKNLTKINLMQSESFNKSAILDIENMLITHMHADGKFVLQNANSGQSKLHNYYQRGEYQKVFEDIWNKLKQLNLVEHKLFEIENSDIFKFSPYKQLTSEQYDLVENLLKIYSEAITSNTKANVIVNGGAGTGKSLIAIYFINMIANILSNNFDVSDLEDYEEDNLFTKVDLIKSIKSNQNCSIGFVIPVPSFRDTVKKVFRSIKELKHIDVISPSDLKKKEYDVLVVDEAHRLKRRNRLTNYGTYDNVNRELGLALESNELDWVKLRSNKLLILFYDEKQAIKESDVKDSDFRKLLDESNYTEFTLKAQLRVKGGNEYIDFINNLFTSKPSNYNIDGNYDVKIFDDCHEMLNEIIQKNKEYNGLCRMLSGLCFYSREKARDKTTTQYNQDYDFMIDGHKYCWNEGFNTPYFITDDKNINKIGCVYTCQGHDLNYAGVILGDDIKYNPKTKQIEYNVDKFDDRYAIANDIDKTIKNIINAYKVLLTRGVYGTYIFATDKNLRDYLKNLLVNK